MKTERVFEKVVAICLWSGILAFLFYIAYASIGSYMWKEYDPITTDISSLGAVGAPNQAALAPYLMMYGILFLIFVFTYSFWSFYRNYHVLIKMGSLLLIIMAVISKWGYEMFPLEGDKKVMTFQNSMHILVTVAVVFLSIAALLMISIGYKRREETRWFGSVLFILTIVFIFFGATNPIGMKQEWNVLGLTERLSIYSLHAILGMIGIAESVRIFKTKIW